MSEKPKPKIADRGKGYVRFTEPINDYILPPQKMPDGSWRCPIDPKFFKGAVDDYNKERHTFDPNKMNPNG